MARFAILAHDWPSPHYDLLFEAGPILKAWRLLAEPGEARTVPAEPSFDHRAAYLDYEGPVSDGRGTVTRWDAGTFEGEIGVGEWEVKLYGSRLRGTARLIENEGLSFQVD